MKILQVPSIHDFRIVKPNKTHRPLYGVEFVRAGTCKKIDELVPDKIGIAFPISSVHEAPHVRFDCRAPAPFAAAEKNGEVH